MTGRGQLPPPVLPEHSERLLEVRNLCTTYRTRGGSVRAADDVTFDLEEGEILGLVGESGCGKSATALSIVRLIEPPGEVTARQILFNGVDLMTLSPEAMRAVRGNDIGFIFQDPMTSLNPAYTVGFQIAEGARRHLRLSRKEAAERAAELLARVGIPRPRARMKDYPHQFSGGMRQRVVIAMALSCNPSLLLADEPTTAVDVTVQAQILELIASLAQEFGTAVLLITHDLGVAAGMCRRINVMYAGRIVESGPVDDVFEMPQSPYTAGLLASVPRLDDVEEESPLRVIEGMPPDLTDLPPACRFAPRCAHSRSVCIEVEPDLATRAKPAHTARCWGTEPGGWIL